MTAFIYSSFVGVIWRCSHTSTTHERFTYCRQYHDGKVIWPENGRCLQYKYELEHKNGTYGDILVTFSIVRSDSLLRFFFDKHVESVTKNPTKQDFVIDHDSEHYVDVWYQGIRYCYSINGVRVEENPDDLRASFVKMLSDENVSSIKVSKSFIGGFPTPDPDSTTRNQK